MGSILLALAAGGSASALARATYRIWSAIQEDTLCILIVPGVTTVTCVTSDHEQQILSRCAYSVGYESTEGGG